MTDGLRQIQTTERTGSSVETLAIVVLVICGVLSGTPTLEKRVQAPAFACCSEKAVQNTVGRPNRELDFRMSGVPLAFEMTAVFGSKDPVVLTISSEPKAAHSAAVSKPRHE